MDQCGVWWVVAGTSTPRISCRISSLSPSCASTCTRLKRSEKHLQTASSSGSNSRATSRAVYSRAHASVCRIQDRTSPQVLKICLERVLAAGCRLDVLSVSGFRVRCSVLGEEIEGHWDEDPRRQVQRSLLCGQAAPLQCCGEQRRTAGRSVGGAPSHL